NPAITLLLNGQAVKTALGSTSVTASRGSRRFKARAQVAPAKPPPITITLPAAPCASAGRNGPAAQAAIAAPARKRRRASLPSVIAAGSWLLPGIPFGDRRGFALSEALGDAVHHRCRALAGAKISHRSDDL